MQLLARVVAKAVFAVGLAVMGSGANAAITISEPEFIDEDTFQVMVGLANPFGVELDGLELRIAFDGPPLSLVQVVKQAAVPGTFESLAPFKFGTISYTTAATVPTGPLFKLIFDIAAPLTTEASIDVTVTALPTFILEELDPINQTASREVTPIPEPTTYALFGVGLVLLAWTRRRRITAFM